MSDRYLVTEGGKPMYRTRTLAEARSISAGLERRERARKRVRDGAYGVALMRSATRYQGAVRIERLPEDAR